MIAISLLGLGLILVPVAYLTLLAIAAVRKPAATELLPRPTSYFAIVIPAHDEEDVIARTVTRMLRSQYPKHLYDVYVIADHCTDGTAEHARQAGATVLVRSGHERSGKGEALQWCFDQVLKKERIDAVILFDADSAVDSEFLRIMDSRLDSGSDAIQGQHTIANPDDGWFPALTWAMFAVDNRFHNLGRANLGFSAKNMGDSICFRVDILKRHGWGEGLTEDYDFRQRLLLDGIKIEYEPTAKAFGGAPASLLQAMPQRERWLAGSAVASRARRNRLLAEGIRRGNLALIDGALQAWLPSYSTLTVLVVGSIVAQTVANKIFKIPFPTVLSAGWYLVLGLLFLYPLIGLALEGMQLKAYVALLSGPIFIVWRTSLAIKHRLMGGPRNWVRTARAETRASR
ncbi:MAG: glycosyltransferase family 2 protein [Anaerolineales bacterium]